MTPHEPDGAVAPDVKPTRFTFPKTVRLRRRREFEAVFERGRRTRMGCFAICALPRPGEATRLGLSVGRRCGNAVARNRIKRRLREAFRLERPQLPPGFDLVIIPTADCRELSLAEARRLLVGGMERLAKSTDGRKTPHRRR